MAKAGEKVLIQTPVYNCFFSSIRNNGCEVVENPLQQCESVSVDWEDFERKCADPKVKVFVLCNPHNPVGRVWTKEELTRMGNICLNNGVFVISDEIHCEFVYSKEAPYTPFASISEDFAQNSAVCVSPSKAYNIAGLQIANIIAENSDVRARIDKAININEVCDVNPFGVIALQAAYSKEGEEWLNELCEYIHGNYLLAKSMIEKDLPEVKIADLQGTYLMWADVKALGLKSAELCHLLQKEGKVYVNPGTMYGEKTGEGYIRINLATRRSLVEEGMRRFVRVCCQHLGR
jgi:cystathionine beta-lyase